MKKNVLTFWIVLFVLSLFVILFVGQKKDETTGKQKFVLTMNGLSAYKKGLDIAGGVRLSYKIDYSKYKETYTDPMEFNRVKKKVEEIIKANIDTRISKLGVSDYNSFIQKMNDQEYLIIEIGGLKDIEEAKNVIGKTIELEFKIPNAATGDNFVLERQKIVDGLFVDVKANPALFAQVGSGKQSDDIYYSNLSGQSLSALPELYKSQIAQIEALTPGSVLNKVLSGDYYSIPTQDESGNFSTTTLKGWSIVKFNGKTKVELNSWDQFKFESVMETLGLPVIRDYQKGDLGIEKGKYKVEGSSLVYNADEVYSGKQAFDVNLYKIDKPDLLGKNSDETTKIKAENDALKVKVQQEMDKGTVGNYTGVTSVFSGWLDNDSVISYIKDFKPFTGTESKVFETSDGTFVLKIKNSKEANQKLTKVVKAMDLKGKSVDQIEQSLKIDYLYNIEDIFVRNTPGWVTAKDPKTGEILNGAYFRYAAVDSGKLGAPVVTINFDEKGKEIFCNITEANIGKQMAIFVGGKNVTAPVIREKICGGTAQIDGDFTAEAAKQTTVDLNEGALPAKLILSHEDKISPLLGENAMKGAMIAGVAAFVFIFVLMVYLYGFSMGTISLISLILFITVLFGLLKMIGYVLSLSGIAAIILSVGMGVDANILIFERINEEKKSGKGTLLSIQEGFDRSMPAIRDGNLTTGVIALLLFLVGTNVFKGFGAMTLLNIFLTLMVIAKSSRDMLLFYHRNDK